MILVESVLGNQHDPEWERRLAGYALDALQLDQWEAQKNRLRKETEGGRELAISLARSTQLRDGDVLHVDESARVACIARIALKDVMVIDLAAATALAPGEILRTAFELGHALGNQHWPAVVKGERVYVPLTVDRQVMASVMRTHRFEGIAYEFVPGAAVIPYLAPHEARRLFGGADATPHDHLHDIAGERPPAYRHAPPPGIPAAPEHQHAHDHPHRHDDGTEHAHPHVHAHRHGEAGAAGHDHAELHGTFAPHRHGH